MVKPSPIGNLDHTRWPVVGALLISLGAAVGQGFARFGYALLLGPMRDQLHWNYAQAGLVNSANAAGYLLGALLVGWAVARFGAVAVIRVSVLVVSLSLILTGSSSLFWVLLLARVLSGIGAGFMFIAGVAAVIQLVDRTQADLAVGVYYAGPGIGIALSGMFVPVMLNTFGWSWQTTWIVLGCFGLLALLLVDLPLRRLPTQALQPATRQTHRLFVVQDYLRIGPALIAYGLFGLGYIGYMTFVVAYLRSFDVTAVMVQWFWIGLGGCAALSGFTWRLVIQQASPRIALAAILGCLTIGALLPVISLTWWSISLSAVLFGSSFLSVVTVVTKLVRLLLPAERWTAVVGNSTALFAIGQLAGPTLTGLIADLQGGLALGLVGSAVLLGIAALIGLFQTDRS